MNAVLLVILLWRQRVQAPGKPLFYLDSWKRRLSFKKQNTPSFKP